jgi:hypothetical protein
MSESGMTIRRNAIPLQRIKESYQMAMTTRRESKTITLTPEREEPVQDLVTQRKRLDSGRFHLQVDRQTKDSYATYEAAEAAWQSRKSICFFRWRCMMEWTA